MNTDKLLLAMPLHAVTEIYGAAGLRQRLTLELRRLPVSERDRVQGAAVWAAQLHAGQRRTREPYLNHPLRVTLRILCHYRVCDPDVLIAALLHDTVEDQPWAIIGHPRHGPPPYRQALGALTARYGFRVARLVRAVTHADLPAGADRAQRYTDHLTQALAAEPWARVIKLSDFTDNGVGIIHTVGPKMRPLAVKYTGAVPVLRDLLHLPDTPLEASVKDHIAAQLDLAEQRFAAILAA
jgi:hypothetical protein